MKWIIYKHTSPTGKVYIGQTHRTIDERWRNGKGYTYNKNTRFSQAIEKYGWNAFKHEIIEDNIDSQILANERERYWISKYNSYNFEFGYNMTPGGEALGIETIEKARQVVKKNNREKIDFVICYELAKFFVNPTIAYEWFTSNNYIEYKSKHNPIVRVIDKANRTCFGYHFCRIINLFTFKPISIEESNLAKGHKKQIICVDSGDIYNSLSECSRILNIKTQHLSRSCKNHTPTHGLYFAYIDDFDSETWTKYKCERKLPKSAKSIYCFELNKKWDSLSECCKDLKITTGELSRLLTNQNPKEIYKVIHNMHFCYYYQAEFAIIVDKPTTRIDSRKVYCVEKRLLFNSITEAEQKMMVKNILKCCKNHKYTAGGYHWCFEEEIDSFEMMEQVDRTHRNKLAKRVKNIDTGEIFESVSQASKSIGRNVSTLHEALKKGTKCGGFRWCYI